MEEWQKHIEHHLAGARACMLLAHNIARSNIHKLGSTELRDLAESTIHDIDIYGKAHVPRWEAHDMGAV